MIPVEIPDWAGDLIVDVEMPEGAWGRFTDFGVTVFDSMGAQVGHGPLSYAFGRHEFDLSRRHRGATLDIELFPAFAHLEPPPTWQVDLTIYLIAARPVSLEAATADTTGIELAPGESVEVEFTLPEEERPIPDGYAPLIEVTTNPAGGATAQRRGRLNREPGA